MDCYTWTHPLCSDTLCCLEDLSEGMYDIDGWWERDSVLSARVDGDETWLNIQKVKSFNVWVRFSNNYEPSRLGETMLYIDIRSGQTCHSKVMHRKEVTHSDGSYEKKSRRRAWLKKWDKVKIPGTLMHRKRVTCKLHDSYFRLMKIKHAIPKIEWAIELLYNSVETGSQWVGDKMSWRQDAVERRPPSRRGLGTPDSFWRPDQLVTRCGRESPHPAEWASAPPHSRLSSSREQERHNANGHKSGGSICCSSVRSPAPSHTRTFQMKWEIYFF